MKAYIDQRISNEDNSETIVLKIRISEPDLVNAINGKEHLILHTAEEYETLIRKINRAREIVHETTTGNLVHKKPNLLQVLSIFE